MQPVAQAIKRGNGLESWERRRKIARLQSQQATPVAEIVLSADQCKGHFDQHRAGVMAAYLERLRRVSASETARTWTG